MVTTEKSGNEQVGVSKEVSDGPAMEMLQGPAKVVYMWQCGGSKTYLSKEQVLKNIEAALLGQAQEIVFVSIEEDIHISPREKKQLPLWVREYLSFSSGKGLQYFFLKNKDSQHSEIGVVIGADGSPVLKENRGYIKDISTLPDIKKIIKFYKMPLSSLVGARRGKIGAALESLKEIVADSAREILDFYKQH